jgi:hypothetical protein
MRKGTVRFGILPVNGKNCLSVQLLTEDWEMPWHILGTDTAVIGGAVFVMMAGSTAVVTNKVVFRVGGYNGDARCQGDRRGRVVMVTLGRGRSRCVCNTCKVGGSWRVPLMDSAWWGRWFHRNRHLQCGQGSRCHKRHRLKTRSNSWSFNGRYILNWSRYRQSDMRWWRAGDLVYNNPLTYFVDNFTNNTFSVIRHKTYSKVPNAL